MFTSASLYLMRPFILIVAFITVVSAAPFIFNSLNRYEEITTIRASASNEAREVASTTFTLIASSEPGCADNVSHAEVDDIPDFESEDVEGIITFANIRVNGAVCGTGAEDEIMKLISHDVLDAKLPGGKVLNLTYEAERTISVGGADLAIRKCGSWAEEYEQRYAFSTHIKNLLPDLSENGFIDNSTIPPRLLEGDDAWMVSAPQDGPGRVCLYRQLAEGDSLGPVPTTTPGPDGSDSGQSSSSVDEGTSTEDNESSGSGNEAEEDSDGIFGDANSDTLELEQEEANQEPACFPGSAQVHLEDGTNKVMTKLEIGDRVMVAPGTFSEVFMFTHRLDDGDYKFIRMVTDSGKALSVTAGHYVYINNRPVIAEKGSVGDVLELADGTRTTITSMSFVRDRGLYNPQTRSGTIMVNGVKTLTYTTAVELKTAHALLTPLRAMFRVFGISSGAFENGADRLAKFMPSGGMTA